MRKRKWLLIVIIVLIFINIIFWSISYFFDINAYIEKIVTEKVGRNLNANITFSQLNITSKILQISDLVITEKDGAYSFRAKQLYFQFSFWKLVFNNFNPVKALKEIRCFSPELVYRIGHKDVQTMGAMDLNAIEKALRRFDYISIINGTLHFIGEGSFQVDQTIEKLSITLENMDNKQWIISGKAYQKGKSGSINIDGIYERNKNTYTINIKDYIIEAIRWSEGSIESAKINAEVKGTLQKIEKGNLKIEDVRANVFAEAFSVPALNISILKDTLLITQPAEIKWRGTTLLCYGDIKDYLKQDPEIDMIIKDDTFNINQLTNEIDGVISIKILIKNTLFSPQVEIEIQSDSIAYQNKSVASLEAKMNFKDKELKVNKVSCIYETNYISGTGSIEINDNNLPLSILNLLISSQDFKLEENERMVAGDAEVKISGTWNKPKFHFDLNDLTYEDKYFIIKTLDMNALLSDDDLSWSVQNPSQSLVFRGNISSISNNPSIAADLYTNNLSINSILKIQTNYLAFIDPNTQAHIKFSLNNNTLTSEGFISFPDYMNTALNGQINLKSKFDMDNNFSIGSFEVVADSFRINNVVLPLYINVDLEKNSKNLNMMIGDMVECKIDQFTQDSTNFFYKGFCKIDSVYIAKINALYPIFGEQVGVSGILDGGITFDTSQKETMEGNVSLLQFSLSRQIHPVDVYFDIVSDTDKVIINNFHIHNSQHLLKGNGFYHIAEGIVEFVATGEDIKIDDFLVDLPIEGSAQYNIVLNGRLTDPNILFDATVKNGKLYSTQFDELTAQFFQDDDMFYVNNLGVNSESFSLHGSGSYSYNFLKEEFHNKPDELSLAFKGDLLKELGAYIPELHQASSVSELNIAISTEETTTVIDTASLSIHKGQFSLKGQPQRIKDFSLDALISNNILTSLDGSFKMGDGELFMDNMVNFNDSDIYLGSINIGTLRLLTDEDGITIHIPEYQPEGALVDTRLAGFESKYFLIYNRDGAWILDGRIFLSNGNAVYEEPDDKDLDELSDLGLPPIHAKFDIVFEKNIWYVASPLNLKIDNGNFMSFRTDPQTDELQLYFDLHSRQGDMRMFGEIFSAEDVSVRKTRTDPKVIIDGEFVKRTPDGSRIYLYVQSTEDKLDADDIGMEAYGDVKVTFDSDNPKDVTMLSILSKIQYGKEIDDLSEEERFNLGREQVINLAGDELSDLILNPLISPVEGAVRQFLGLDFVRVRPGIMRNIIETSGIVETDEYIFDREFESDLELIGELSRDILLENLTIDLGKYITPDWYLNYEALIKKEMTALNEVSIGIQHEFSLTWDLPYNFRFKYKYRFNPALREDNQGISLETVFHF